MFKVVLLVSVHFVSGFYDYFDAINSIEPDTKVRLESGKDMSQGRLEVFVNGEWGTVCDDDFDVHDAQVVCRMLGIETQYPLVRTAAYFGEGTGKILLDDVQCSGTEFQILDCRHGEIYNHNCGHGEDVGIDCSPDMDIDFILATDPVNGSIYKLQGSAFNYSSRLPLVDLRDPLAVDFDDTARRIYWTSYEDKQIFSASLDGRDRRVVFSTGQNSQPYGIAVDGRSRLIFYTDEGTRSIAFVTITTQMHKIIINSSLDKPRAIVLDKENGVIMWSDWGRQPKIEQANYDGSDRYQLVNTSLAYPNGLALDMDNNLLYWSDAGTDKVECLDLEGNIRTVIFQAPVTSHFFGLAVDGLYLYLVDSPGGFMARESHVLRMNRDGTDQQRLFTVDSILYDIHFYTKAAFNRGGSNGCRENNGGCSHICIPTSGNSTRCLCPEGYCESTGFMNCTAACPGA